MTEHTQPVGYVVVTVFDNEPSFEGYFETNDEAVNCGLRWLQTKYSECMPGYVGDSDDEETYDFLVDHSDAVRVLSSGKLYSISGFAGDDDCIQIFSRYE
jgi:hypothetical protein